MQCIPHCKCLHSQAFINTKSAGETLCPEIKRETQWQRTAFARKDLETLFVRNKVVSYYCLLSCLEVEELENSMSIGEVQILAKNKQTLKLDGVPSNFLRCPALSVALTHSLYVR